MAGQDVLSQWQFISIRRLVEKGRYYHECNQFRDDDEEALDAGIMAGAHENPKVPKSIMRVGNVE
jgi:hypothetical protein